MNAHEFVKALKRKSSKDGNLLLIQKLKESNELIQDIIDVLEEKYDTEIFNSICEALFFVFNDVDGNESQVACLQFVPALIWAYYSMILNKTNESKSKVETILLAIYNQNVRKHRETPCLSSFRVPTLSQASVFHETLSLNPTSTLTANALSQHENVGKPVFFKGPSKHIDYIPAGFRSVVLNAVLKEFNFILPLYTRPALVSFCNMVTRLSCCGYKTISLDVFGENNDLSDALSTYPKVRLASSVAQEMIITLQFVAYNSLYNEARPALKCLHQYCQYSLLFAGVLNTNALEDLLALSVNADVGGFEQCPPINPKKCSFRGKGKSSTIGANRSIYPRSYSIDHHLLNCSEPPSSTQLAMTTTPTSKELGALPSSVSIHIDSSYTDTTLIETPKANAVSAFDGRTSFNTNTTTVRQVSALDNSIDEHCTTSSSSDSEKTTEERVTRYVEDDNDSDKTPLILNDCADDMGQIVNCDSGTTTVDRDRCSSRPPLNVRREIMGDSGKKRIQDEDETAM